MSWILTLSRESHPDIGTVKVGTTNTSGAHGRVFRISFSVDILPLLGAKRVAIKLLPPAILLIEPGDTWSVVCRHPRGQGMVRMKLKDRFSLIQERVTSTPVPFKLLSYRGEQHKIALDLRGIIHPVEEQRVIK